MKIPFSWLREFVEIPKEITVEEICSLFIQRGFEVEGVENPAGAITGPLVIGRVVDIEELSGHKKPIRYVELDCAEKEHRFVICGATNFKVGDKVVVAMPGAVLPGNFAISARETYGKTSNGMICSARELGLSEDHSGIMVVPDSEIAIGADALQALTIDDPVIDISVNPDRGYAMSLRGAAREIADALHVTFNDPAEREISLRENGSPVPVAIDDPTGAEVIHLRTLSNINAMAATPWFMQRRLQQCGMRSISIAVDITNYVMLEIGQPLHAFDTSKIDGSIRVRRAKDFATLETLDGQKRKLSPENLVISDDSKPLAIAGTMGGADSEVRDDTQSVAIEAAHFYASVVAKNSRSHILSSEASRRFERGVDPLLTSFASARAAELLIAYAGAQFVGTATAGSVKKSSAIELNPQEISQLVGHEYSDSDIKKALTGVGCVIDSTGKSSHWSVQPPAWRPDLTMMADLAEEVARVFGYDAIPSLMPDVKIGSGSGLTHSGLTQMQKRKREVALHLAHQGFTEVQTYPFVSAETNALLGFTGDRAKTFAIANPMSAETPYLRTHLTPGLLAAASLNINRGEKSVAIFEIGAIFRNIKGTSPAPTVGVKQRPTSDQIREIYASVPLQPIHVGGILAGEYSLSGWWGKGRSAEWSDAIDCAAEIIRSSGNTFEIKSSELAPWHPGRCAEFIVDGKPVAHAGELHPRVVSAYGLPPRACAFVVILDALPFASATAAPAVWTMPAAIQDISLIVDAKVSVQDVESALRSGAGELLESITLFDRYDKVGDGKISLAFTMVFRAHDRTLTAEEVSALREKAGKEAELRCGATIRSN